MSEPTFPLDIPTSPSNFTTSQWIITRTVGFTQSPFTYSQQVSKYQGAIWQTTVTLPPMTRADAGAWQSFYMQLSGRFGTFLLGDPDASTIQGSATGVMKANANHAVGAFDITVDGLNSSQSTAFKKGDYVQFGSGATSKLHMIVANISTNGSGEATLQIEPPLKTAISNNDTIVYSNTKAVMRMDNNSLSWDANNVSLYGLSFSCTESL
tara:strand:- start:503 stop:1132 length:630 start_codon:yes stop_codon:yes gene_type:complete